MDGQFRLRLVNSILLAGILLMYVVYDTGFRFWMSQSDVSTLNAMLLRNPAALKQSGGAALAFEAATEATLVPALQTYLFDSRQWARVVPAAVELRRDGNANAKSPSSPPSSAASSPERSPASSLSDFPMAAVVVESSWLSPDHAAVSAPYAQRLLEGYRYALLTGAPWLLLAGSAEETALGLQHLRRMAQPAETLFGKSAVARWPAELQRMASVLHTSMLPYETLEAWMQGADAQPIPSFLSTISSTGASSSLLHLPSASPASPSAALRFSLNHLLSATSLTDVGATALHGRPSALILGAEWLQRSDAASLHNGRDEALSDAMPPRVTVYANSHAYTAVPADGVENTEAAPPKSNAAKAAEEHGSWESARVLTLHINGTRRPVHITVPGVVAVTAPDANKRARYAAKALQRLMETTLVHRHALLSQRAPQDAVENAGDGWWWWLGRPFGVTVIGGSWEQQRVKLLYMNALREAAAETRERIRTAVQDVHRTRCQFESGPAAPLLCSGARRTRLPASALPFAAAVPSPAKVFVLPPAVEDAPVPEPQPKWLNYTGELPPHINAGASHAARVIGRWSFFLYANYRRRMDWVLASVPVGAYQDHFVLASVLMSDLADRRISWRDVLNLR